MELEFKKIDFHKKCHTKLDYVKLRVFAMCYSSLEHSSFELAYQTSVCFSSKCGFLFFLSFVRVTWDGRTWLPNKGKNGPLPLILEIFCPETLFPNNIAIYHILWYSSLVSSSTIFFNPPWHAGVEKGN